MLEPSISTAPAVSPKPPISALASPNEENTTAIPTDSIESSSQLPSDNVISSPDEDLPDYQDSLALDDHDSLAPVVDPDDTDDYDFLFYPDASEASTNTYDMITQSEHYVGLDDSDDADSSFKPPEESNYSTNASNMITNSLHDDDNAASFDSAMPMDPHDFVAPASLFIQVGFDMPTSSDVHEEHNASAPFDIQTAMGTNPAEPHPATPLPPTLGPQSPAAALINILHTLSNQ